MANCCVKHKHLISKTSFAVPAKLEQKRKWEEEEALNIILKKSHRVCASHFKESDIKFIVKGAKKKLHTRLTVIQRV